MWQYGVLFSFQPIVVLGLHIKIHACAVLGCMDHVCTDHSDMYIRVSVFASTLQSSVAQAATDVLEVSKEAIERQVTSEVEGTLLTLQHTYRETSSIYRTVSKGVKGKVKVGTYTEVEGTLKCKSKKQRPLYTYSGWSECTWSVHPNTACMCICMCKLITTIGWEPNRTLYCHVS